MAFTREELLERLLDSYAGSYDIERDVNESDRPELAARAHFFVDESQYMISKKAVMYSVTSDEYVWFFTVPRLTAGICDACISYAWDKGLQLADHASGKQMVTRISAVFIADTIDDDAENRVVKCRLYKSFQFSLKGWMECHTAAVDLGKESAVSNRYGRETAKHLKNLLRPAERQGSVVGRLLRSMMRRG